MTEPRWLDDREQQVWLAFIDMSRQLAAGMEQQLAGSGISGADYQLLAPLSAATGGALRPRDLARSTGWDRSRLAHQLRRMEQRGLITREDCADDARGTLVLLTKDGKAALRRAAPGHVAWVREHFIDALTPAQQDALAAIAAQVVARLQPKADG